MRSFAIGLALVVGALFGAVPPLAQPVALAIEEAVDRALSHNARVLAAEADARAAEAVADQVRAARIPSVHAAASYTRLSEAPSGDIAVPGVDTTITLFPIPLNQIHSEIRVEAPLFTGGRLVNSEGAARRRAEAARLMADQDAVDVAFEVRAAYWRLYQALATQEALEASLRAMDEHVRHVAALVEEGAALEVDLLAVRTRRSEVRLEQLEQETVVQTARLDLNRLVGLPLDTDVTPTSIPEPLPYHDLAGLVAEAEASRPDLGALAARARALEADLAATRGRWLPELNAFGRYVLARPNPIFFLDQDEFRGHFEAGLSARWGLFEGGARVAARREAEAHLDAGRSRLEDARTALQVEVTRRYLNLQLALEAVEVARDHLGEVQESYRVLQAQWEEGALLTADLLQGEAALRAARARAAAARGDAAVAEAALLNAVGRTH